MRWNLHSGTRDGDARGWTTQRGHCKNGDEKNFRGPEAGPLTAVIMVRRKLREEAVSSQCTVRSAVNPSILPRPVTAFKDLREM